MLVDYLEQLYRDEASERQQIPDNPFRASAAGHCIRAGCFSLLGLKGQPLQPRRIAVFKHGTLIHDALTADLKKALGWRFVAESELGDNHVEIDGVKISYHIDGAFQQNEFEYVEGQAVANNPTIGIVEIKSMSDWAFERAKKGEVDREYVCQAWVYLKGTDFNPVVFLAYRKETSHMVEIIFDRNVPERIVTQRLTGNPIELAKQDPLMLTEIRTPFDESVEGYVRERIGWLKQVQSDIDQKRWNMDQITAAMTQVPGADAVEDEIENVQGEKAAVLKYGTDLSRAIKSGSWYKFKTGRKILGFPCSYCQHMERCFPNAKMEMNGERPIWVQS